MQLTPLMKEIIEKLNEREAPISAEQAANTWASAKAWHPDSRNAATNGLRKKIKLANKQAERGECN